MDLVSDAKLVAIRDGHYTIYVFQDINSKEYIMCTRPPNWQTPNVDLWEEGFLQYQIVKAGEEYFEPETGKKLIYNYSNVYFTNFVKKTDNKSDIVIL